MEWLAPFKFESFDKWTNGQMDKCTCATNTNRHMTCTNEQNQRLRCKCTNNQTSNAQNAQMDKHLMHKCTNGQSSNAQMHKWKNVKYTKT